MSPYTRLAVRTLGPAQGLTLEEHREMPTHVPNSPSRGSRNVALRVVPNDDLEWKNDGACVRESVDLFYGDGHDGVKTQATNRDAKKVCARCPVEDRCLEWALLTGERWGVWGGLTARERGKMLAARERLRVTRPTRIHVTSTDVRTTMGGNR